jgi:methylase of polypeptide subunit release factors
MTIRIRFQMMKLSTIASIFCNTASRRWLGEMFCRQSSRHQHKSVHPSSSYCLRVVDVGTGSGLWVIEVAHEYPSAHVVGFDISKIERNDVPSNAEFIVGDVTNGIPLKDNSTDLVASR